MSSVTSASTTIKSASDLATLSTPDSIRQKHYFLNLTADFEKKILVGSTTITFVVLKENASVVHLVQMWKEEESRNKLIALAELRKKGVKKEIKKLSSMDEVKARIMGISEDEVLNG